MSGEPGVEASEHSGIGHDGWSAKRSFSRVSLPIKSSMLWMVCDASSTLANIEPNLGLAPLPVSVDQ
jgi:hypothetical protein